MNKKNGMNKKFSSTLTNSQIVLARRIEETGLATYSQVAVAFERDETSRIEEWKRQLDEYGEYDETLESVLARRCAGRTTINLGADGADSDAVRENLRLLAQALGLGGNISALMRWLAEVYYEAPDATMTLLRAAYEMGNPEPKWFLLSFVRQMLDIAPPPAEEEMLLEVPTLAEIRQR